MWEEFEDYHIFLTGLVKLQHGLILKFEAETQIIQLPADFPQMFDVNRLNNIIKPEYSISEILRAWPSDILRVPLPAWVRPRIGVFEYEDKNWLFVLRAPMNIRFIALPIDIAPKTLNFLRAGKVSVLQDIATNELTIDTWYSEDGHFDEISPESVHVFAQSTQSKLSPLSESEHKQILENLTDKGLLAHSPKHKDIFWLQDRSKSTKPR